MLSYFVMLYECVYLIVCVQLNMHEIITDSSTLLNILLMALSLPGAIYLVCVFRKLEKFKAVAALSIAIPIVIAIWMILMMIRAY